MFYVFKMACIIVEHTKYTIRIDKLYIFSFFFLVYVVLIGWFLYNFNSVLVFCSHSIKSIVGYYNFYFYEIFFMEHSVLFMVKFIEYSCAIDYV